MEVVALVLSSAGFELMIYLAASVSVALIITRSRLFQDLYVWLPIGKKMTEFLTCPTCLGSWLGFAWWSAISWWRLGAFDPLDIFIYGMLNSLFATILARGYE